MGIRNLKHIQDDIQCTDLHNIQECIDKSRLHYVVRRERSHHKVNRDKVQMVHLFFLNQNVQENNESKVFKEGIQRRRDLILT